MSDELKLVVRELSKPPYGRNFNLITFDSLEPEQLLQVLNDVFAEIDPKNRVDIREEEPEAMAVRMLGMLRVLQYRPPEHAMLAFRAGLVAGEKHVVQPVIAWLLHKPEDLKKRAYLAKFLVKLEVPQDFLGDVDIGEIYAKYTELVDQFKEVHREHESLLNSSYNTAELRKDMTAMEEERDLITHRIAKSKYRVQANPGHEEALQSAQNLRVQKEKQKELTAQKATLTEANETSRQRYKRLETQIKDIRKASIGASPDAVLRRLEEDVSVNSYMVNEKLPSDVATLETQVAALSRISQMPAMGQNDIDQLNDKLQSVTSEISGLNEVRMKEVDEDASTESKMGKLSFFRQNAAMITRRKQQTAEKLTELRGEVQSVSEEIKEKQDQLLQVSGEEVLRGDDFKRYINSLRTKSSIYKMKRAELSDLRAEYGILSRTQEILKAKEAQINSQLSTLEAEHGVSGFRSTKDTMEAVSSEKAGVDEAKGETLEQMSELVMELNRKIGNRKSRLAPIIKELRPLRQQLQELTVEHSDKKQSHDSVAAGLDSTVGKLERDVTGLYEGIVKNETQYHLLSAERETLAYRAQVAEEEIKLYLSSDPQDKKKAKREQLVGLVTEQEKLGRQLREEQKNVKDQVANSGRQLAMWQDVIRLMEVKRRCLEASRNTGGTVTRSSGSEALVIN